MFKRLLCRLFGHRWCVVDEYNRWDDKGWEYVQWSRCARCSSEPHVKGKS